MKKMGDKLQGRSTYKRKVCYGKCENGFTQKISFNKLHLLLLSFSNTGKFPSSQMLILFYHCFLGCSLLFVKLKVMIYPVLLLRLSFHSGIMASVCQLDFALIVIHMFGKRFLYCCIVHGRPIFSSPHLSTLTICKLGILVWVFRVYWIFFCVTNSCHLSK